MKKGFLFFLSTFLLVMTFIPGVKADEKSPSQKVIVVFKNNTDSKAFQKLNGKVDEIIQNIDAVSGSIPEASISKLKKDTNVVAVEKDQKVRMSGQTISWGINKINATNAWKSKFTGRGVKVALLDTGISKHSDLTIAGGVSFVSYTKSYNDDNGHGTVVAGIVGAKNNNIGIIGVAPDVSLYAVKVLDSNGEGYLSTIMAGIEWAIKNHMDIINISLGTNMDSPVLHQEVDKAYKAGILVVASAGNNGQSTNEIDYPARYSSVIAVGAVDSQNHHAYFSSEGPELEVSAPGVSIYSTYLNNQYVSMSGTSMASPFVVGDLALLKQEYPKYSNVALREKLDQTALDLGSKGKDNIFGYGLIQAPYIYSMTKFTPGTFSDSVITDKSTYKAGSSAQISVKVLDSKTKKPVSSVGTNLVISTSKGSVKTVFLKTNSKGIASYKFTTNKSSYKGKYKIMAVFSKTGYSTNSITKTVSIK